MLANGRKDCKLTEDEHSVVDEEILHAPWPEGGVAVEEDYEDHPSLTDVSLAGSQLSHMSSEGGGL